MPSSAWYWHDIYNFQLHLAVCNNRNQYRTSAPEFISFNHLESIWKKVILRYLIWRVPVVREVTGKAHSGHAKDAGFMCNETV